MAIPATQSGIGWVRRLKEFDPPIQVFFEQEHLDTLDTASNISQWLARRGARRCGRLGVGEVR